MGVFDKALRTAKDIGNSVSGSLASVGSSIGASAQDASEIANLKMQISTIEQELDVAYQQIGKKYVEHVMKSGSMGDLDIADLLRMMDPKMTRKLELEAKVLEIEKRMKQNDVLREQACAEQEFAAAKARLDRAFAMDLLTQAEYDAKLTAAQNKLNNFSEIRRIEQLCDMGIITKEERDDRIGALVG